MIGKALVCSLLLLAITPSRGQNTPGELMMRVTVRIEGPARIGTNMGVALGTGFFAGVPIKETPNALYAVVVTADHVFRDITGDFAIIQFRRKSGTGWEQ